MPKSQGHMKVEINLFSKMLRILDSSFLRVEQWQSTQDHNSWSKYKRLLESTITLVEELSCKWTRKRRLMAWERTGMIIKGLKIMIAVSKRSRSHWVGTRWQGSKRTAKMTWVRNMVTKRYNSRWKRKTTPIWRRAEYSLTRTSWDALVMRLCPSIIRSLSNLALVAKK